MLRLRFLSSCICVCVCVCARARKQSASAPERQDFIIRMVDYAFVLKMSKQKGSPFLLSGKRPCLDSIDFKSSPAFRPRIHGPQLLPKESKKNRR